MKSSYPICMDLTKVGNAVVDSCGLYWKFSCRISINEEGIYRLTVQDDHCIEDLGTFLRDNTGYYLITNVPKSRFSTGNFVFQICTQTKGASGEFYPLAPDKPFLYLAKLKQCHLEIRNSIIGIVLP